MTSRHDQFYCGGQCQAYLSQQINHQAYLRTFKFLTTNICKENIHSVVCHQACYIFPWNFSKVIVCNLHIQKQQSMHEFSTKSYENYHTHRSDVQENPLPLQNDLTQTKVSKFLQRFLKLSKLISSLLAPALEINPCYNSSILHLKSLKESIALTENN